MVTQRNTKAVHTFSRIRQKTSGKIEEGRPDTTQQTSLNEVSATQAVTHG
jgi:hypothetical protein